MRATVGTIASHIRKFADDDGRIFVKMDIEGAEYEALEILTDPDLDRISQLVLEMHELSDRAPEALALLGRFQERFVLVHLHGNNCLPLQKWGRWQIPEVVELTWVHRSLCGPTRPTARNFPSDLDAPNVARIADLDVDALARGE